MKYIRIYKILFILVIFFASTLTSCNKKQKPKSLSEQAKDEFLHSWNAYKKYAYKYDMLLPISKKGKNWYTESLLMTPVDALDAMYLMGLEEEAKECKKLIINEFIV